MDTPHYVSFLAQAKLSGIQLPKRENDVSSLTVSDFMDKIQTVWLKTSSKKYRQYYVREFLELIVDYPVSICSRGVSETLKHLINLMHQNRKDLSYDDLAIIFGRSKASIHTAIKGGKGEADTP